PPAPGTAPAAVTVTVDVAGAKGLQAIAPGETIDLLPRLDLCPVPLLVPSVVDLPLGAATAAVVGAGLTVGHVRRTFDVMPIDQVIGQNPPGGAEAGPANVVD